MHVTFDYHPAQVFKEDKRDNRGEMSDVLLLSSKHMLSIECKFLSNINFGKDVREVQERIIKFSKHFKLEPLQILLLKQEKSNNSKHIRKELENNPYIPIVVLFWEDLLSLVKNDNVVKCYLNKQMKRKKYPL